MGTAISLRLRSPAAARDGMLIIAFAAWATITVALYYDLVSVPYSRKLEALFLFGAPLAVTGGTLFKILPDWPGLRVLAGAMCVTSCALAAPSYFISQPLTVLGLPVLLASAILSRRRPAPMLIVAFAGTGMHGTIVAYTGIPPGQIVDVILGGLWLGLLLALMLEPRKLAAPQPELLPYIAFLFVTLCAIVAAPNLELGLRGFRASTWYMLAVIVVAYAGFTRATFDSLVKGIVVIGVICGGYAAIRWGIGHPAEKEKIQGPYELTKYNTLVAGEDKVQGFLPSGHELGFWLSVVIPFYVALAYTWKRIWRGLALAAAGLCFAGLLASGSRTGLIGAVGGALLVLLLAQMSRGFRGPRLGTALAAVVILIGGATAAFVTVVGDNPEKVQRYKNILRPSQDEPFQLRLYKWSNAFADIKDRPFGRGLGTGGSSAGMQRFPGRASDEVDSSYVKVAYEQGPAVMILLIAALLTLLIGLARRSVWTRSRYKASLGIGAAGTLLALGLDLAGNLYINRLAALSAWMIIGIGIAQFLTPESEDDEPAEPAPA